MADIPLPLLSPVCAEESGQKLLQFLQRRLALPSPLLHRWIRTGQVRRNGARCKPFERIAAGDLIRLPPFANRMAGIQPSNRKEQHTELYLPLPPKIGEDGDLWAFNKPSGLPVHPGTGHGDSLWTRLTTHFQNAPFCPTPVHRLDKDTSGVLLTAFSYEALAAAQNAIRRGTIVKEYVAWVSGRWPFTEPLRLEHTLCKKRVGGYEKIHVNAAVTSGRQAHCVVCPLDVCTQESLVLVRLLTGRTHQIRVQLAAQGHAVIGDAKYGHRMSDACRHDDGLLLHALRVTLPSGRTFSCLPPWKGKYALKELPEMSADYT